MKRDLGEILRQYTTTSTAAAVALAVLIVSILFFAYTASQVLNGDTLQFDKNTLTAIHSTSSNTQDVFWQAVTHLGGFVAVPVIALLFILWLYRRKEISKIITLILGVGGAVILNSILKIIFDRDRPDLWEQLIVETSHSFPSGHSMASASLAVSIVVILWHTRWRLWALVGGAVYVALIGYSRLYLGVHYPTDVMAGWAMSAVWVLLVALIARYYLARRQAKSRSSESSEKDS